MRAATSRLPCLALLALATTVLAVPARAAVAPAPLGPPAICHPIAIGDAVSLPWNGDGSRDQRIDYDLADVVEDTRAVLRGTSDTLVHMETLRRAVIYLTGIGGSAGVQDRDDAWRGREIARLVALLKADIVDAQLAAGKDEEARRRLALAWFDAGYALCALDQSGKFASWSGGDDGLPLLEQAATLAPQDGAMSLGLSIAHFGGGRPGRACYAYLDKAVTAADDPEGLLRRNVLYTMGSFLGTIDYDELAAKVRHELERA
ncbi:MAG: hypothetical protein ACYTG2_10265 [Planctomycetota bacterium]|jgi:hypothetical protein